MLSKEKENDLEALGSSNYRYSLEPVPGCSCSSCTLEFSDMFPVAAQHHRDGSLNFCVILFTISFRSTVFPTPKAQDLKAALLGSYTSLGTESTA